MLQHAHRNGAHMALLDPLHCWLPSPPLPCTCRFSLVCAPERMRAVGLQLAELGYPEILMFQARGYCVMIWPLKAASWFS